MAQTELVKAVRAALERDRWVSPQRNRIEIQSEAGVVVLTGVVVEIAAKRRAHCIASEVPGVTAVDDRLQVEPAEAMGDDEILAHLVKLLEEDPVYKHYGITAVDRKGEREVRRQLDAQAGWFLLHVEDGIVYLEGKVKSLCDRRLAGAMAWWVPGSLDVINDLEVDPPEKDSDEQLKEALALVLDVDPFIDHQQIAAQCLQGAVVLTGVVPVAEQIQLAEHDCWYVDGVRKVDNRLTLA
ncbi:MAG: BON domain-containing protein [Methylohalobius sp. ZOD2]|nr:BON domain-containing protein [Methylothermaceae bacterium]